MIDAHPLTPMNCVQRSKKVLRLFLSCATSRCDSQYALLLFTSQQTFVSQTTKRKPFRRATYIAIDGATKRFLTLTRRQDYSCTFSIKHLSFFASILKLWGVHNHRRWKEENITDLTKRKTTF